MSRPIVSGVSADSPAERYGIFPGDAIVSINGRAPTDIIEYQQFIDGPFVKMDIERGDPPRSLEIVIEKSDGQPLGITIDSAVFDRIRTCDNHCSFCFIYQLPKGLRKSLYVKDDDFRLSFLYGNYTTLTRFTEFDLERVIDERLSPLYVSIHVTNPHIRAEMLRNPRGSTSLRWLREFLKRGISVHGQIVACPGVNDGAILRETLLDVVTAYPELASVAVVPVGVSAFNGESTMRPFTTQEASDTLRIVEEVQNVCQRTLGRTLVYASDEMYVIAGHELPEASHYESLDEAENGIGMVAAFRQSFSKRLAMSSLGTGFFQSVDGAPALMYRAPRLNDTAPSADRAGDVVILTGEYAAPILSTLIQEAGFEAEVRGVANTFFGGNIKVAGLMTGSDINRELATIEQDTNVLIPDVCLSEGRFLDGLTLADLNRPVTVVPTTGIALREALESIEELVQS